MVVKVIKMELLNRPTYIDIGKIVAISEPVRINDTRFKYYIYFDFAIWTAIEDKENTTDFDKYEDILNAWKKLHAD